MAVPHLAEQVGRVLDGRYRVIAPIGTGASAAVFLADDVVLRRRVAIKVLHAALAGDQAFLKRFQAEAHTAAALSHPNVMRVLDWGEADDGPFLVLEYLGGGSLRAVLDETGTLTVEQAVAVGLQAARALDYAHRRGLVHRDVKPANLLFDEEGRLAIADFGLARALAEAAWTEPGGAVLGTARYASPEQVRGQSLDGKADVYALGLVLIEALSGYVPFTADTTIATLMARLDVQLEAPAEMGALGPIVEQATNPDPAQRIDAAQMVALLETAATGLPQPQRLTLPGAVPLGLSSPVDGDPTMLPATNGDHGGLADAQPFLADPMPPRRGLLPKRRRKAAVTAPAIEGTSGKRRRIRRPPLKKTLLALLTLVLTLGLASGAYALYFFTGKELAVPELNNMSLEQARAVAEQADVRLSYEGEQFSETVPPGLTFNQSPSVGGTVHTREPVRIHVSKGPAPRPVIDVRGQTLDPARQALAERGFVVTVQERFDETIPKSQVIDQQPLEGDLDKGTEVRLVVSGGPEPRTIQDLSGRTYEEAVAVLSGQQLQVARAEAFSDTVPVGQVAGTTPGPGARVQRGATVTVNVSKGPDLVAIPDVRGRTVAAATTALTTAGFQVNNVYGPAAGRVFRSSPDVGTRAKRGSSVSLYTE